MKSLLYISKMNLSSQRAHVYNTVKTCEALNNLEDLKVTLVSTDKIDKSSKKLFSFELIFLNSIENFFRFKKFPLASKLGILFANLSLIKYMHQHRQTYDIIYCRDPFLYPASFFGKHFLKKPLFFEVHAVLHRKASQRWSENLVKNSNGLIVISRALKDYCKKFGKNILVSFCSAAEPARFAALKQTKQELRKELQLPNDKILLGYTGNLSRTGNNDSYGIEDIINSLPFLPEQYIFVGVGKKGNNTAELENLARQLTVDNRVLFIPWTDKETVIKYIRTFDILCIPAAGAQIGNSPTKVFEYLVSNRPIVAAQTQAISEILVHEQNALLVDYKNPQAWAKAIISLYSDQELAKKLIAKAVATAQQFTWQNRGLNIYDFIKDNIKND